MTTQQIKITHRQAKDIVRTFIVAREKDISAEQAVYEILDTLGIKYEEALIYYFGIDIKEESIKEEEE